MMPPVKHGLLQRLSRVRIRKVLKDNKRLLGIKEGREAKSLHRFFDTLNKDCPEDEPRTDNIEFVCSDMWKQYLKVIAKRCPNALNILDKFCRRQTGKHCTSKDI